MSQLNLSNIKRVGFIENFNPKKGYPEFARKVETPELVMSTSKPVTGTIKASVPKWKKNKLKAIKRVKKEFKSRVGIGYKPSTIASNKLN